MNFVPEHSARTFRIVISLKDQAYFTFHILQVHQVGSTARNILKRVEAGWWLEALPLNRTMAERGSPLHRGPPESLFSILEGVGCQPWPLLIMNG